MKKQFLLGVFLSLLLAGTASCGNQTATTGQDGWENMLDKDLSKWRIYQSFHTQDMKGFRGKTPTDSLGNELTPIGYDKNLNDVFRAEEIDGELVLHISGEIYGSIFTKEDYSNYRLRMKVKFGEAKFEPRLDKPMDSGVIYHSAGECGAEDYFKTWMRGNEFQVQDLSTESEECFGNYWTNGKIRATAHLDTIAGSYYMRFNPEAELRTTGSCMLTKQAGNPHGEWTELELICFEGKSLHLVNGEVVLAIQSSSYMNGEEVIALKEGKIQLQCEAGEVFYKDIAMLPITEIPAEYQSYFDPE